MTYTIIDAPQRSPEWFAARLGRITSSRVDCIFMHGKKGAPSKTRDNYGVELALERIYGQSAASDYTNTDMQRGVELEPAAIAAVEAHLGILTEPVGFLAADDLMVGTSPDAIVRSGNAIDLVVEVKAPRLLTHYGYLQDPDSLWADYEAQCRHHLWVSGARSVVLASYCPQFTGKPLLVLERERTDIDAHADAVKVFLLCVEREMERIKKVVAA